VQREMVRFCDIRKQKCRFVADNVEIPPLLSLSGSSMRRRG
jgi:hypothetical protein